MNIRNLGPVPYGTTFEAMQAFTAERNKETPDELWICEHPPVFTQGLAGREDHLLAGREPGTLQGDGPFTVFAPTNDAFAALPAGVLDALLLPENLATLTKILTYHVVAGMVMAADVKDGNAATVEGSTVKLSTKGGVSVNKAKVVIADVMADNGVIHAIDAVILPKGVDVASLL